MTWNVKGTYIETCSCDFFCPCNFSFAHGADYDRCRVTLVFNITEGDVEGTDVGGLVVAVVADTPKVMTEGNWRVGVLIDDKASDEQADKLVEVFSGQLGGPMAALGPLIGENLGVQRATIEVQENGLRHSVRSATRWTSRSRTLCRSALKPANPSASSGCSIPPARNSGWPRRSGRTSTRSASRTKASPAYPHRSSPGPLDAVTTAVTADSGGLRPAFAAARARLGLVALLFALAAVAWWWTVDRMRGMDAGPGTDLGTLGWFLGIWIVMMAAMMFPSVAPTVALYTQMTKKRSPVAPPVFVSGYLLTWTAAGLLAFGISEIGGRVLGDVLSWDRAGRWVAGGILVVAAVYNSRR